MNQVETKNLLKSKLGFTDDAIKKLAIAQIAKNILKKDTISGKKDKRLNRI